MAVMPYCPVLAPMRPARLGVAPIPPSFATIVSITSIGPDQLPLPSSPGAMAAMGGPRAAVVAVAALAALAAVVSVAAVAAVAAVRRLQT